MGPACFRKSCSKIRIFVQNQPYWPLWPRASWFWKKSYKVANIYTWCTQGKSSTQFNWRTRFECRTRKPAWIPLTPPRFASARPVVPPKGATTVPKFLVLGIFELRSVDGSTIWEKCVVDRPHTSPQPARGDVQLKKLCNLIGLKNGNVTCGHNWMVPDGSHAQI